MSLIGDKGDRAVNESPGDELEDEGIELEDARLVSETATLIEQDFI